MKAVVERLIERHGTYGVDWMGFELRRSNPLTYHHIKKDCDKGKKTMENGALLSRKGHRFLNCLELTSPDLYETNTEIFSDRLVLVGSMVDMLCHSRHASYTPLSA